MGFHQKYSSQTHKVYEDYITPSMPQGPKEDNERRTSDASTSSSTSTSSTGRRGSATNRFEEFKRPTDDPERAARRASLQDSYGRQGFLGSMWNSFTRGPINGPMKTAPSAPEERKGSRDTSTLR